MADFPRNRNKTQILVIMTLVVMAAIIFAFTGVTLLFYFFVGLAITAIIVAKVMNKQKRAGETVRGKAGNLGLGIFIGFILTALLWFLPIMGALIAGIVAGIIARGTRRGLVAGFASGIIGLVLLIFLLTALGAALGGMTGAVVGGAVGTGISGILGILGLGDILLVTIGGFIGGAISPQEVENQHRRT